MLLIIITPIHLIKKFLKPGVQGQEEGTAVESVKAAPQQERAASREPLSSSALAEDCRSGGRGGTSSAPSLPSFDSLIVTPLGLTQEKARRQQSLTDTTFSDQPPGAQSIADKTKEQTQERKEKIALRKPLKMSLFFI